MTESPEIRLKRLKMRSMRRGIKEMDLILGGFAAAGLAQLSEHELEIYETLLTENDHDLYRWVTTQTDIPSQYLDLLGRIGKSASGVPAAR